MTRPTPAWPGDDHDDDDAADGAPGKSKSQIKRELLALDPLARRLLRLPDKQRQSLALGEALAEALRAARTMQRGALQRQLRYIRGLLAEVDHRDITRTLDDGARPQREEVEALHEVETWRDRLLDGDTHLRDELLQRYPAIDRRHLLQLIRNADKERSAGKAPRAARVLFKYLSQIRAR